MTRERVAYCSGRGDDCYESGDESGFRSYGLGKMMSL